MGNIFGGGADAALDTPDPVSGITPRQVQLVQSQWGLARQDLLNVGLDVFILLFTNYPEYQKLFRAFADVPMSQLRSNPRLRAHATTVMYALTNVIDALQDPDVDLEVLKRVGRNHAPRKVTRTHFYALQGVVVEVLKQRLGAQMNDEALAAWGKTLEFAFRGIFEGLDAALQEMS